MDPLARKTIAVPATTAGVRDAAEAFEAFIAGREVPPDVRRHCLLALDELLSNVVRHGGPEGAAPILVSFAVLAEHLEVEIADASLPFDPLQQPAPDRTAGLEARPIGGLGIALVRATMADVRYERRDGRNVVTVTVRLSEPPS
jgi:serine/threonine-protein kinase RsbW